MSAWHTPHMFNSFAYNASQLAEAATENGKQ